jgi:hypothetical protein
MRIYNNYDGWQYTIKNLSLGLLEYKDRLYYLDNAKHAEELLQRLVEDKILERQKVFNTYYYEYQYKFNLNKLSEEFIEAELHKTWYQWKPTLLNMKMIRGKAHDRG